MSCTTLSNSEDPPSSRKWTFSLPLKYSLDTFARGGVFVGLLNILIRVLGDNPIDRESSGLIELYEEGNKLLHCLAQRKVGMTQRSDAGHTFEGTDEP